MPDDLLEKVKKEQNRIIDECTMELLHNAGIDLPKNYTNIDLLIAGNTLARKNYTLEFKKSYSNKDWLVLYNGKKLIKGYEFDIIVENNSIKIITLPIE